MRRSFAIAVAVLAIVTAPTAAFAASDDVRSEAAYPPPPPKNLQLSTQVLCHESAPQISFTATPIGFTPVGAPTGTLTFGGNTLPASITALTGSIAYPEAATPTGLTLTIELNGVSASSKVAQITEICSAVAPPKSLDVTAFSPVCVNDVPFITYTIKTIGFTSSGNATLTFFDKTGKEVSSKKVNSLTGTMLYPGAAVDANGNGIDWPGWKKTDTGEWVLDDSDAILRQGLTIQVEVDVAADDEPAGFRGSFVSQATVNLTAMGSVTYPDATPQCSGPQQAVATPPTAELPRTGASSIMTVVRVAALLLVAGLIVLVAARRRSAPGTA